MKRNLSLTLAMFVLMFTSIAQADYDIFPVSDSNAVNPDNPDISGDWIVWQDDRGTGSGVDIYGCKLSDPNVIAICLYSEDQEFPAVDGNVVVWQDYQGSKRNIYAYDLPVDEYLPVPINNGFDQRYPDISGNIIVWQDDRNGDKDIYTYNIATDTEQAVYNDGAESWGQYYPAIDEGTVVWLDTRHGNYQIYRCDIGGVPQRVSASLNNQMRPAISGSLIVWEEVDTSNNITLVAYDLGSGDIVWTYAVPGTQANAAVSDGIIVWQEEGAGPTDYNIRCYDTTTGAYLDIAIGNQDDQKPSISGRCVVWRRNSIAIVGAEIPSPTQLQVDTPMAEQMFLAGTQIEISWHLVEGTPPDYVDIDYSVNNGADWQTVASDVAFSDFQYTWDPIPDVNEIDSCQIRVSDVSDSTASDVSGIFSIFQCDNALTADLTGDCFVGLADIAEMARQWLTCGNPHDPTWCGGQ
ncbi:MAG: hypothetical protein ACYTEU_12970 [Planctomycetota bacterium]